MADGGESRRFAVLTETQQVDVLANKTAKTPQFLRNTQFPSSRSIVSHDTDMPMHIIYIHCTKKPCPWTRCWNHSIVCV